MGRRSAVLQHHGNEVVLKGSFTDELGFGEASIKRFVFFKGDTKMVVSKGVDFNTADLEAAANADDAEDALLELFFFNTDKVIGSQSTDSLFSAAKGVKLTGRGGDNHLFGITGRQTLKGGNGDDTLDGWRGKDTCKGGRGEDLSFFTDYKLKTDTVMYFSHKNDAIILKDDVFSAIGLSELKNDSFRVGKKAKDSDDYVVYHRKSGTLSYDADGQVGIDPIKFAVFTDTPKLKACDFLVIGFG